MTKAPASVFNGSTSGKLTIRLVLIVNYADGNEARVGDIVSIDGQYWGTVVVCVDRGEYADAYPAAQWSSLGAGILVDTDFGGLVHYSGEDADRMTLVKRKP